MKISTKGEYGIRAMIELSARYGGGYIQSAVIASARDIPRSYLYQILITLRKSGLVRSRRGPQGGHMLARPPERISLLEVVLALEGPIEPVTCIEDDASECPFADECAVRDVWIEVTEAMRDILENTSLATVLAREREKRRATT